MEILWKPTEMIILFGSIPVSVGLDLVQRWLFLSSSEYYFWTFQCWTNPSHTTILKHIHTMYRININKHDSLYMNMYVYIYTLMYIYIYICMNEYIYIYICMKTYLYIYARICVYIYTRWILIPNNLYQYEYTWQNQNPSGLALALTILLALAKVWVKTGNTCILRLFPFFRDLHMDFPGIYTVFFIHNISRYIPSYRPKSTHHRWNCPFLSCQFLMWSPPVELGGSRPWEGPQHAAFTTTKWGKTIHKLGVYKVIWAVLGRKLWSQRFSCDLDGIYLIKAPHGYNYSYWGESKPTYILGASHYTYIADTMYIYIYVYIYIYLSIIYALVIPCLYPARIRLGGI